MASPQRPDPDEPRRSYENLERDRLERERMNRRTVGTGAGFAWWWVFWIVIIALAIWWAGWGWGASGGWWWGGRGRAVPPYGTTNAVPGTNTGMSADRAATSGPGLSVLNATDKQSFIGKPFQLSNVPVQRKVSNRIFWIGANSQSPMLVVLNGNEDPAQFDSLTTGNRVDVAGTVTKAPPTPDAASEWPLSDPDLAQLEKEGVYVAAAQIHRAAK